MTYVGKNVYPSWQRNDQLAVLHVVTRRCVDDVLLAPAPMHQFGDLRTFHWSGSDEPSIRAVMQRAAGPIDLETVAYRDGRSAIIDLMADPPSPAYRATGMLRRAATLATAIEQVTNDIAEESQDLLDEMIEELGNGTLALDQALGRVDLFHPVVIVAGSLITIEGVSLNSCRLERRNIADGRHRWIDLVQIDHFKEFRAVLLDHYERFYQGLGCRRLAA